jgi:hypothetical protein
MSKIGLLGPPGPERLPPGRRGTWPHRKIPRIAPSGAHTSTPRVAARAHPGQRYKIPKMRGISRFSRGPFSRPRTRRQLRSKLVCAPPSGEPWLNGSRGLDEIYKIKRPLNSPFFAQKRPKTPHKRDLAPGLPPARPGMFFFSRRIPTATGVSTRAPALFFYSDGPGQSRGPDKKQKHVGRFLFFSRPGLFCHVPGQLLVVLGQGKEVPGWISESGPRSAPR